MMQRMKTLHTLFAAAALGLTATPVLAALDRGAQAPGFTAPGALAGKPIRVDLRTSLKQGPVVLYFFPAAFTSGCNLEAQAFAAAIGEFRAAGATVIGMTGNTDQLREFSAKHCAGEFPVAAATPELIAQYDVSLGANGGARAGWSDRTTYVIDTDGTIAFVYSDLKPNEHIARSLAAVRSLKHK